MITGATRLAGIIGDPVRHSLSPLLHNTAYAELGLDWVYLAFPVPAGEAAAALDAMRALELVGLSVTMPHKTDAAAACDELTDDAAALRSVNTVTLLDGRPDPRRHHRRRGIRPRAARSRAANRPARACSSSARVARPGRWCSRSRAAGAHVTVTARRPDAAASAAALGRCADGPVVRAGRGGRGCRHRRQRDSDRYGARLGRRRHDADADRARRAAARLVVADLVYHPLETPLLAAARAAGAHVVDGLGMLVHQAALQVERWSGQPAPVARDAPGGRRTLSVAPVENWASRSTFGAPAPK